MIVRKVFDEDGNMIELDPTKWGKFLKVPVEIRAFRTDKELYIETLEGTMKANKGDWVIRGIKGELYPCKPDIFEEIYVEVCCYGEVGESG